MEPDQLPLTPDMPPIIRPEVESLEVCMPHFPMTKLSVMIDKTQHIIL